MFPMRRECFYWARMPQKDSYPGMMTMLTNNPLTTKSREKPSNVKKTYALAVSGACVP